MPPTPTEPIINNADLPQSSLIPEEECADLLEHAQQLTDSATSPATVAGADADIPDLEPVEWDDDALFPRALGGHSGLNPFRVPVCNALHEYQLSGPKSYYAAIARHTEDNDIFLHYYLPTPRTNAGYDPIPVSTSANVPNKASSNNPTQAGPSRELCIHGAEDRDPCLVPQNGVFLDPPCPLTGSPPSPEEDFLTGAPSPSLSTSATDNDDKI